ncbi:hypothetical protein [Streptomyces sp. NPDC055692]|uniref:hypothetical protein n=1 Tax=Streptomyces sp. NPDC055692 TaxID=3155683 RepID=UPI0034156555
MAAKTAAKKTETAEPMRCTCSQFATEDGRTTGCMAETKRLFAPGHDAKLKSALIRWGAEGVEVTRTMGSIASSADAATHAAKFAFGHMVKAGIKRVEDKAAAKAERQAKREQERKESLTRHAAKRTRQMAKKNAAEQAAQEVKAKVGRWERTGTVKNGQFTYTDAKGATKTTTKFTLIG